MGPPSLRHQCRPKISILPSRETHSIHMSSSGLVYDRSVHFTTRTDGWRPSGSVAVGTSVKTSHSFIRTILVKFIKGRGLGSRTTPGRERTEPLLVSVGQN